MPLNVDTRTVLSLCAGIGGLDLGLRLANPAARAVCYVEREATAAAILAARFEDGSLDEAPIWSDLRTFDGRAWRGCVDILTAGYPCQPFSVAGQRRGEDDPRHLWPHVARIIRECEPNGVFLENVGNHLKLGFREVALELRDMGFRVEAGLFTAEEVGAPHRRERLFALAYAGGARYAEPERLALCGTRGPVERRATPELRTPLFPPGPGDFDAWRAVLAVRPEIEPAICGSSDGLSSRVDRLRALGNGVVPLVAAHAFRTLTGRFDWLQ